MSNSRRRQHCHDHGSPFPENSGNESPPIVPVQWTSEVLVSMADSTLEDPGPRILPVPDCEQTHERTPDEDGHRSGTGRVIPRGEPEFLEEVFAEFPNRSLTSGLEHPEGTDGACLSLDSVIVIGARSREAGVKCPLLPKPNGDREGQSAFEAFCHIQQGASFSLPVDRRAAFLSLFGRFANSLRPCPHTAPKIR